MEVDVSSPCRVGGHTEADHLAVVSRWRVPCLRCRRAPIEDAVIGSSCAACLVQGWIVVGERRGRRPDVTRIKAVCGDCAGWWHRLGFRLGRLRGLGD